jgi:hypothetical protein
VQARVRRRDFPIVSNNCWETHIYQCLGEPYRTPFIVACLPENLRTWGRKQKKGFTLPGWWLSPKLASESGPFWLPAAASESFVAAWRSNGSASCWWLDIG